MLSSTSDANYFNPITPKMILPNGEIKSTIKGNSFIHTNEEDSFCTVLIDPILTEGVELIEFIFHGHEDELFSVGIAESSKVFGQYESPYGRMNNQLIMNIKQLKGELSHIIRDNKLSYPVLGNSPFHCEQKVSIEVDMNTTPRTLTFFIDGEEQKNSVISIPKSIRFFACILKQGSSFEISKFQRLTYSKASGVKQSLAWIWGEMWKQ
ncbi:MAG: hypothetical protein EZS28_000449 [Streblomastix strix]|uniref:Uncharacterized protein n=1 Tax=Streblomastix strix TaxID=222440 RepID=A0A5J4X9U8_9EUKA|nr:MAG: hypothetical protein EZS28_000449 [Streblomastix strix]